MRDEFLDTTSVGHEPADVQVRHIVDCLANSNIHLAKMLCLSRDNPTVMRRVFKLLQEEVATAGCPRLVDAPCLLHPTHTAFQCAVKSMKKSIVSLLGNLHSYFKTSTARREDMVEVREELGERMEDEFTEVLDQFFLRHVDTRWLESGPAIQRLLEHWDSTVEYFMVYLPNSPLQSNKKAIKSEKYKAISCFLCEQEVVKTKVRAKFLLLLSRQTKTFLTLLQSEKPLVHKLLPLAGEMFGSIANMVVKPAFRSKEFSKIKDLDLEDASKMLDSSECGFMACCREEVNSLEREARRSIRGEMKKSTLAMLSYLQTRIPWDNDFLLQLSFLDPTKRAVIKTPEFGVGAAVSLKRFTEDELGKLAVQLNLYQALPAEKVPKFSEHERIDHFWVKVLVAMEETTGEKQQELERLVKLCCSVAHGNAFLERGMSITKRVVDGRSSMSEVGVKASKVVKEVIRRHGGVTSVPITRELLSAVCKSSYRYREELRNAKEEEVRAAKDTAAEVVAMRKRKAEEEDMKTWRDKKVDLQEKIKASQQYIDSQERTAKEAMEKCRTLKSADTMRTSMMAADLARGAIVKEQKKLTKMQEGLVTLVGKKPKSKTD